MRRNVIATVGVVLLLLAGMASDGGWWWMPLGSIGTACVYWLADPKLFAAPARKGE